MKSFRHHKPVVVLTALFLLASCVSVFAHPKDKDRWDNKYSTEVYLFGEKPIPFLVENVRLLPKGKVLDIAMGEGRNGVYLATQGFDVLGLDISEKGLQKAHKLAEKNNVTIETQVVDLETYELKPNTYDVILCSYYMQRNLFKQFEAALKPGGMIVVETYNVDYLKYARFSRKWALDTNELLDIFKSLRVIRYQDYDDGKEAYSSIIAQKLPF
jgi:tellurite methyltransferase